MLILCLKDIQNSRTDFTYDEAMNAILAEGVKARPELYANQALDTAQTVYNTPQISQVRTRRIKSDFMYGLLLDITSSQSSSSITCLAIATAK